MCISVSGNGSGIFGEITDGASNLDLTDLMRAETLRCIYLCNLVIVVA